MSHHFHPTNRLIAHSHGPCRLIALPPPSCARLSLSLSLPGQSDSLDRAATEAGQPMEGRDACLAMVRTELAAARREAERLQEAATAAEAARVAQSSAVATLQAKGKSRSSALRVQIESESAIIEEQRRYVESLEQRERATVQLAPTREEAGAHARVNALVDGAAAAASTELSALKKAQAEAEDELELAKAALISLEARAASHAGALTEKLATTREAVVQLAAYEVGLSELLQQGRVRVERDAGRGSSRVSTIVGATAATAASLWTGVAGSRVSLLTSPDVVTIAVDGGGGGGGGKSALAAAHAGGAKTSEGETAPPPKAPPNLEQLRKSAAEAVDVIDKAAAGQHVGGGASSADKQRPLLSQRSLTQSLTNGLLTPVDWVASALSPRGAVPPLTEARAEAEAEAQAKAVQAEAAATQARVAAAARAESAVIRDRAAGQKMADAAKGAATARAAATMASSGKSEVDGWLDKRGLAAAKAGLAGAGIHELVELANMDPPAVRQATAGLDGPTRAKLMKAIDGIEIE